MRIDYIALGILLSLVAFSILIFIIIRKQSRKSKHPDAQRSNAGDPTPLHHAPDGSQSEYSASLPSLHKKPGAPDPHAEMDKVKGESRKSKRKLFFDDTAEDQIPIVQRGSQEV